MRDVRPFVASLVGILVGASYGAIGRLVFAGRTSNTAKLFVPAMSITFLFLIPAGLGALTVFYGSKTSRRNIAYGLFMPWISCSLMLAAVLAFKWEGMICLVLAAPVFLFMSSLGGLVMCLFIRAGKVQGPLGVTALVLLPFVTAPLERRMAEPPSHQTVITRVTVAADPATVWRNVIRVPEIRADELRSGFFQRIGFPRPVEASLSGEGAGALRLARFAKGLTFREPIDVWVPERKLSFTIQVDPASFSAAVLDEHVAVGGAYFDVLRGTFTLEPLPGGSTLLLLSSEHRVSTRLNGYATVWSRALMADLQERICRVIKARAETKRAP